MDPFQDIVVQVISNGKILDLYDGPDVAKTNDGRTRQHYIEAITGASFSVKVMLTTEFKLYDLRSTDAVRVTMNVDGQPTRKVNYLTRRQLERKLLRGKPGECIFTGVNYFCPRAGLWMQSDYTFGKLETSTLHIP